MTKILGMFMMLYNCYCTITNFKIEANPDISNNPSHGGSKM